MAGLVGAGRSEIARATYGIDLANAGTVTVCGRKLPLGRPDAAIAAGSRTSLRTASLKALRELPIYETWRCY